MRCSSFSAADGGFFGFFRRSLDAIAEEVPLAHDAMCRALGSRTVELNVDGQAMRLSATAGTHVLTDQLTDSDITVELERPTIVKILEGQCTLVEATVRGDVLLQGSADDLVALSDALTAFVQGAVRSVSTPAFLAIYLKPSDRSEPLPKAGAANLFIGYPA